MSALDHNTGIEVLDLQSNPEFLARALHTHDPDLHLAGMQRIAAAFTENRQQVLQELSDLAVTLCQADSAGVSIETTGPGRRPVFHWVAISGEYARFLDAMLPHAWMPCGVCLDRMQPQLVRVPATHFHAMDLHDVAPVTDGMLIPWQVESHRGTIWILAHGRSSAFDRVDYKVMQTLSDFAAMAVRHHQKQQLDIRQAQAVSAAAVAHELAHRINNPLQKITNSVFLAATDAPDAQTHVRQAADDLHHLSIVVQQQLVSWDNRRPVQ